MIEFKKYNAFPVEGIADVDRLNSFLGHRHASLKEDGIVVAPSDKVYDIRKEIEIKGYVEKAGIPIGVSGVNADYENCLF